LSFKVLIVEDEKWIHSLLQNIVDWSVFGFEIIGFASSGWEAYHFILEHEPDLVVSDVCMPGLSGIDLIKMLRAEGRNLRFVLISGHQEFSYAQEAVKYKVEDYLLKPIEAAQVAATLSRLSSELMNERDNESQIQGMRVKLDDSIKRLRIRTFDSLLRHSDYPNEIPESEIKAISERSIPGGIYQVLLLGVDIDSSANDSLPALFYSKIDKELDGLYDESECLLTTLQTDGFLAVLLNCLPEDQADLCKRIFKQTSKLVGTYNQKTITLCVGRSTYTLNEIAESFISAKQLMQSRALHGGNRLVVENEVQYSHVNLNDLLPSYLRVSLATAFELFRANEAEELLQKLLGKVQDVEKLDPSVLFQVLDTIVKDLENRLATADTDIFQELGSPFPLEQQFLHSVGINTLFGNLTGFIIETLPRFAERQKSSLSQPIEKAKRYLKDNFNTQVSLAEIADYACLSQQYLSELFKKETGTTISDFLRDYRVSIAKTYIRDGRYRVTEIAGMVGYSDARYFSKTFKRTVGVTPKEFRRLGV